MGDAGPFGRLSRRDLGFLDRSRSLDLASAGLSLVRDACIGHGAILLNTRLLDCLACRDLGFFHCPHALDVALAHLAFRRDPCSINRALIGNPGFFDLLAGEKFLFLDCPGSLDLPLPGFPLGGDTRFGDRLLVGNTGLLDGFTSGNLRLFGLGLAQRALARYLRALQGATHLDIALLLEPGGLALALDLERLPLGLEVARADLDHRILLDVVAQFPPCLDILHKASQTFCVEAVGRIEIFKVGLVEIGDRDRFELKPVLGKRFGCRGFDPCDVLATLLMHLLHSHFRSDGTDGGDKLARQQGVQLRGLESTTSERRGRYRNGFAYRLHTNIEVGLDVDAHAVAGDDGVLLGTHYPHRQHIHVDGRVVVNEGQHEGAAIDHDALAEEAGTYERDFLRRTVVEPVHDVDANDDPDDRDNQPEN